MTRLLLGLCAFLVAVTGWALFRSEIHKGRAERALQRVSALEFQLDACTARADNLLKDKESDDAIDRIPDDGLRNAPAEWMLPPPGGGGLY